MKWQELYVQTLRVHEAVRDLISRGCSTYITYPDGNTTLIKYKEANHV